MLDNIVDFGRTGLKGSITANRGRLLGLNGGAMRLSARVFP